MSNFVTNHLDRRGLLAVGLLGAGTAEIAASLASAPDAPSKQAHPNGPAIEADNDIAIAETECDKKVRQAELKPLQGGVPAFLDLVIWQTPVLGGRPRTF